MLRIFLSLSLIVLLAGCAQTVFVDPSAGTCTAGANTGNGTCTIDSVFYQVRSETLTFTASTAGPSATFSVSGSVSGALGSITSGSSQTINIESIPALQVTLSDGGTPYAISDSFTVTTSPGSELRESNFNLFDLEQVCSNDCDVGTAQLQIDDGILATPGVSFSADTDSGLRRIGADNYSLVSGSLDALTVEADQDVVLANTTASRALQTGAGNEIESSSVTTTELGYVSGVTSGIQSQIDGKEPTLAKGNLTEATSSVLTITGGTAAVIGSGTSIEVDQADTSNDGYLSSTDWNTFNNKVSFGFTASNDNRLVRTDTVGGNEIQESGITVNDSDDMTGITDLTTDERIGVGGALNSNAMIFVSNTLTGTSQFGLYNLFTASSAATSTIRGIVLDIASSGATVSSTRIDSIDAGVTVATGDTITHANILNLSRGITETGTATNSAYITTDNAYSGDFFLYSDIAQPSLLSGNLANLGTLAVGANDNSQGVIGRGTASTGYLTMTGDQSAFPGSGGKIDLYGSSHASKANDIDLISGGSSVLAYDSSVSSLNLAPSGTTSTHTINGELFVVADQNSTTSVTIDNNNTGASSFTNVVIANEGDAGSELDVNANKSGAISSVFINANGADQRLRFRDSASAISWVMGGDQSAGAFVISNATSLGSSNALSISTDENVTLPNGNLDVTRSASGADVIATVENTNSAASSTATLQVVAAGTNSPQVVWDQGGSGSWSNGIIGDGDWVIANGAITSSSNHVVRIDDSTSQFQVQNSFNLLINGGDLNIGGGTMYSAIVIDSATTTFNALSSDDLHNKLNNAGAKTLNGISAGQNGQIIRVINEGGDLTVNNENGSASAANRIITGSGAAITITADGGVTLIYDSNDSRWRVMSFVQ